MKHTSRYIITGVLLLLLLIPVVAQQGGDGNEGNGVVFIDNIFNSIDLGIPGGPICETLLEEGDNGAQEWIRFNNDDSITVHWVDREATVRFWEEGAVDADVWEGSGQTTLNYTFDTTSEQINWHVNGTVTNALSGETRGVVCHVIQNANGEIKVFNLSLKNR